MDLALAKMRGSAINSQGFSLSLVDSNCWWITGTPRTIPWVEKLAAIMELQPGEPGNCPRLSFSSQEERREILLPQITGDGWQRLDQPYLRSWYHHQIPDVFCEFYDSTPEEEGYVNLWYTLLFVQLKSVHHGGLPLHAALVENQGRAVALAGAGTTGKSTCAYRIPLPWRSLCDDEVLVVRTIAGRYASHPFPTWSDYFFRRASRTWKVEEAFPLVGIFLLEQSLSDEVFPLGRAESAVGVFNSAAQVFQKFIRFCSNPLENQLLRKKLFSNACDLVNHLPVFRLRVCLDGRFWEDIEKVLMWR